MLYEDQILQVAAKIVPRAIRAYASANGWVRRDVVFGDIAIFSRPDDQLRQLIVPQDPLVDDYARRVVEIARSIAEVRGVSVGLVLRDLSFVESDVFSFRLAAPGRDEDLSLPLDEAIGLLNGARRAILASASTVLVPQSYHPRMSRVEAELVAKHAQMAHTAPGSFVFNLSVPLNAVPDDGAIPNAVPFARRATELFVLSLNKIVSAIDHDRIDRLLEADGNEDSPVISSNLCEALVMMRPENENATLTVTLSPAASVPLRTQVQERRSVRLLHDHLDVIEQVGRRLRPQAQAGIEPHIGNVDSLNGEPDAQGRVSGEVFIRIFTRDPVVKARVALGYDDYQRALRAHGTDRLVKFRGRLRSAGRTHRVEEISEFEILDDLDIPI